MKQDEKFRSKCWNITKENYGKYIRELNKECKKTIDALGINEYNVGEISNYAKKMYFTNRYDEVEAEYMTLKKERGKIMPVKYPEEIQKLIDIFEPYMVGCHLENAPKEAIEAAEKFKKWAWEQGQ